MYMSDEQQVEELKDSLPSNSEETNLPPDLLQEVHALQEKVDKLENTLETVVKNQR